MGKPFIDRTGLRYGRLFVKSFLGKPAGKTKATWECVCDCGKTTTVTSSNLATGHTTSCGCFFKETTAKVHRFYDEEFSSEYKVWRAIKQRTGVNPGKNHKWYSQIEMAPTWKESFNVFLNDVGKRPSPKHSIERIDSLKGYEPGNCIWATAKEQANNRRSNVHIEHDSKRLTVAQWAEETSIKQATISARLRRGWHPSDAVTLPLNTRKNDVSK